jgi:2,3-bisphosphoglycerate-independent phosphoglycerate mutase
MNKKVILVILDGWGKGDKSRGDAISNSKIPFINSLYNSRPNSCLTTFGEAVGLPEGQMGNSEVGHMNIGSGRIVYQMLVKINIAFRTKQVQQNVEMQKALSYAVKNNKKVHLIGLLSDGGVHSSIEHVKGLVDFFKDNNYPNIFLHAFLDGRDTDPKSGAGFLKDIEEYMQQRCGKLATVIGRYYSMDRDKRWERIKVAYDMMVNAQGEKSSDILSTIKKHYEENVTDEFMKPVVMVDDKQQPIAKIEEGDVVINFNFRTDRGREITVALTQQSFHEYNMHPLHLQYFTLTRYDDTFKNVGVIFDNEDLSETLGQVLSEHNKTQLRMAETEKYPHVTFFFSGGQEAPFPGEERIMCSSPKVATYDLQPEMSADCLRENLMKVIPEKRFDFVLINFANADMVGHTGVYEAVQKAVEKVDACTKDIVELGLKNGYEFIITADHGNADNLINPDGSPNTAHSMNPVPCFYVGSENIKLHDGKLSDIAPTVLQLMGIPQPKIMDGKSLID